MRCRNKNEMHYVSAKEERIGWRLLTVRSDETNENIA